MLKFTTIMVFVLALFYQGLLAANEASLEIQWQDQKLSITARQVTVCEVLAELAEKTNTKISNDNPCDNPINLNIKNKTFDEALGKIFKHDSYVLVDDGTERKLLVYKRGTGQYGSKAETSYDSAPVTNLPVTSQSDASPTMEPQPYELYQDPNAIAVRNTPGGYDQTIESAPQDLPQRIPEEPPFNPDALLNNMGDGVSMPDPNEVPLDNSGAQQE